MLSDLIAEGLVRKGRPDPQQAKALLRMAAAALRTARSIRLDKSSASSALSVAYSALRQVLEAMCISEGYKVYSHKAYTQYLQEKGEPANAARFDRLRKLRNGVEYYAESVSVEVAEAAIREVADMQKALQERYLKI